MFVVTLTHTHTHSLSLSLTHSLSLTLSLSLSLSLSLPLPVSPCVVFVLQMQLGACDWQAPLALLCSLSMALVSTLVPVVSEPFQLAFLFAWLALLFATLSVSVSEGAPALLLTFSCFFFATDTQTHRHHVLRAGGVESVVPVCFHAHLV